MSFIIIDEVQISAESEVAYSICRQTVVSTCGYYVSLIGNNF